MSQITQEEFDAKLDELVASMTAVEIFAMPGVYEIVSEQLNNEVIRAIESDRE